MSQSVPSRPSFLGRYAARHYLFATKWIWYHLPLLVTSASAGRAYGRHLHRLVQLWSARQQFLGTFFFRNRPELELLIRLLDKMGPGAPLDMAVVACSKGAEVYSISYAIRHVRPNLNLRLRALDISEDVLRFAEQGVYSSYSAAGSAGRGLEFSGQGDNVADLTSADQNRSIFERMSPQEMDALFDREGNQLKVKPRFREGITWHLGDAGDPGLEATLGPQDIVVANRFLCHMKPQQAERCLRNLARLVKPGGYLFVSGVDLDVRSLVAHDLGWKPVTELIREIHDGDASLRRDWPLTYWGLEPFDERRADWQTRYASVFQL